jgi:hypothetical protein
MRKILSFLRNKDLVEQFVVASRIGGGIVPRLAQDLSNHVAGTKTDAEAARRLGLALIPTTSKWVEDGIKRLDELDMMMRHKANIIELERIIEAKEVASFNALKEYHTEDIRGRYPQTELPLRSHDTRLHNNDQAMLRLIERGTKALDLTDPTPTPTQPKWMLQLEKSKDRSLNQGASVVPDSAP